MVEQSLIEQVAALIQLDPRITILTGAGVSKESGIPTFRDAMDGLWARFDPQHLATPEAFMENPKLVWDWYDYRRGLARGAQPNPGHFALAQLQERYPETRVVTQNVDDLHEQAGSKNVIHLHGSIARSKCFHNCQGTPTLIDITAYKWDHEHTPPPCPHCGRWVRPDVVWFGEVLPEDEITLAAEASINCAVMLVVGTSGLVHPAAALPEVARRYGAAVIEVNPFDSAITPIAEIKLDGSSGEVLPRVLAALA